MTSKYDSFQVCLNGHSITRDYHLDPGTRDDYCSKCGAKTIRECPECGADIRGRLLHSQVSVVGVKPPRFCRVCGAPYPWTTTTIKVAEELINEATEVNKQVREDVIDTLPDLLTDTPRTELGANRMVRFLRRASTPIGEALHKWTVDVASETAKKIING